MKRTAYMILLMSLVAGLGLATLRCEDEEVPDCDGVELAEGSCAGITQPEICDGTFCTDGVSCSRVWYVDDDAGKGGDGSQQKPLATLDAAGDKAKAGQCIALAAGTYAGTTLDGGVSLLGTGADHVTITGKKDSVALAVTKGSGGVLRGFSIAADGVAMALSGVSGAKLTQVRVKEATGVAIDARKVTKLALENVYIVKVNLLYPESPGGDGGVDAGSDAGHDMGVDMGADSGAPDAGVDSGASDAAGQVEAGQAMDMGADGSYGICPGATNTTTGYGIGLLLAQESTAEITNCALVDSGTMGILAHGSAVTIKHSAVVRAGLYGVALDCTKGCPKAPAASTISDSLIDEGKGIGLLVMGGKVNATNNTISTMSYRCGFAVGVQVQNKADITFTDNKVRKIKGQGMVIDDAKGTLKQNTIDLNEERGLWIQNVGEPGLLVQENVIDGNEHAGLGLLSCTAVTVKGGRVSNTKKRAIVVGTKYEKVGDGLQVHKSLGGVKIDAVKIDGNNRVGLVINESKLTTVTGATISGSGQTALIVQKPKGKQTLTGIKDDKGAPVSAVTDKTVLVSTLPIPIPGPVDIPKVSTLAK